MTASGDGFMKAASAPTLAAPSPLPCPGSIVRAGVSRLKQEGEGATLRQQFEQGHDHRRLGEQRGEHPLQDVRLAFGYQHL
jgi:hypothetical protein